MFKQSINNTGSFVNIGCWANPRGFQADRRGLSKESVVEGILGRGNWDDVLALIDEWGIQEVKQIFDRQTAGPRTNYRPRTIHFFRLYFDRHA